MPHTSMVKRFLILLTVASMAATGCTANLSRTGTEASAESPASPKVIAARDAAALVADDEPPRLEASPSPSPSPSPSRSPVPDDGSLRVGSTGEAVRALQQRLTDLHYMAGKIDGVFSSSTRHGLIAFQKVEGLPRTGVADAAVQARLGTASIPAPKFTTPADHLEVDLPRQVVFVVRGGAVEHVLPTSTGSNKLFTNGGWTRRAVTPNGVFKINRKINAMRVSPLGELYKPSYFNGGIAFHGNGSVPTSPASHGCVRLPMPFATWFFDNAAPIGMTVYVYGGPSGENPQPTIEDAPAPEPTLSADDLPAAVPSPSAIAPVIPPSPVPSPAPEPSPSPSPSSLLQDMFDEMFQSPSPQGSP